MAGTACPTPRRCTEVAWPAHAVEGKNSTTFVGQREHLPPGLYEFSVRARDIVGNESGTARYRFRILGKAAPS
jgi:predicted phage tail protein